MREIAVRRIDGRAGADCRRDCGEAKIAVRRADGRHTVGELPGRLAWIW